MSGVLSTPAAALLLCLPLGAAAADLGKAPEVRSVAVLPLGSKGKAQKEVIEVLDDLLLSALEKAAPELRVIGKADIDTMVGFEKTKYMLGCDQIACAVDVAGALGVDSVITGNVGLLGKKHLLSLVWIDQKQARVIRRISEELGADVETFDAGVLRAASALLGRPVAAASNGGASNVTVVIEARGTADLGVEPMLELWVDGKRHAGWSVPAQAKRFSASVPASACTVSAVFTNDACSACFDKPPRQDRNLEVLGIEVGDKRYQPGQARELTRFDCVSYEDVASTGVLYCNMGWITAPVAPGRTPSRVTVRARGSIDAGVFPNMNVYVNGKLVRSLATSAEMRDYELATPERACWAQVRFDNDSCTACNGVAGGGDRNLEVDWVSLDGARIDTLDERVLFSDCWASWEKVNSGRPTQEILFCQDAGFFFHP